jgi:hypothetical protein
MRKAAAASNNRWLSEGLSDLFVIAYEPVSQPSAGLNAFRADLAAKTAYNHLK